MFHKILIAATTVLSMSALSATASASEVNGIQYNELSVGYIDYKLKTPIGNANFDGYGIGGQLLIGEKFLVDFEYASLDSNVFGTLGVSTELTSTSFGVGFRIPVGQGTDIVPGISYSNTEIKLASGSSVYAEDDSTTSFSLNLKHRLSDSVQGTISLGYNSDATAIGVGVLVKVNKNFGIGLTASAADGDDNVDATQFTIRASYLF